MAMIWYPELDRPRLRPIEAIPIEHEGETLIGLHDPSGLAKQGLAVSPPMFFALTLMNGLTTIDQITSAYTVVPARVVVHGHEAGGAMACMVAFRHRELVRAVAVVDAPIAGRPPENDPLHRLAIYLTTAKKSKHAAAMRQRRLR